MTGIQKMYDRIDPTNAELLAGVCFLVALAMGMILLGSELP